MGLIWKGEGGTANLKKKIGVWSPIKYFVTFIREAAGNFSSRNLSLCREKQIWLWSGTFRRNVIGAIMVGAMSSGETWSSV